MGLRKITVAAAVAGLVLAGCGTQEPDPVATDTPAPPASTETETEDPGNGATEPTDPGPTEPADLPGEPFGRAIEGQTYSVVGVAFDDTLNVRVGPGPEFAVVAQLDPTGSAVATGQDRLVDSGLWLRLDVDGTTGWANYRFLSIEGLTDDITSQVRDTWGGDEPAPATMEELGILVAEKRASDGEPSSRIVIVVEATVGDLGEVTVDVLDLGDDSIAGERLVVFGEPIDGGFMLRTVERTILCDRGVDDGLCV